MATLVSISPEKRPVVLGKPKLLLFFGLNRCTAPPNVGLMELFLEASNIFLDLQSCLIVNVGSYPLKMVVFNRNLLFQGLIFRGYVSFREGTTIVRMHLGQTNSK